MMSFREELMLIKVQLKEWNKPAKKSIKHYQIQCSVNHYDSDTSVTPFRELTSEQSKLANQLDKYEDSRSVLQNNMSQILTLLGISNK